VELNTTRLIAPSLKLLFTLACSWGLSVQAADYRFDSSISREVLENYLSRSISFTELLHDDFHQSRNARGVDPRDNIRFLTSSGAKLVGRALMMWGGENNLPVRLERAKAYIDTLHKLDPDMILQAAIFEFVTRSVEVLPIPPYVFTEFGLPVVTRNFKFADIIYADGRSLGGIPTVPDMSRIEARMWFYYLATQYIDVGIEGFHFGQVGLMDQNDKGHVAWLEMLGKVRSYAKKHARRHMVICDAHTSPGRNGGEGGYVEGGRLLFDVHAFPLRIAEVTGQPYKGVLKVNASDALYLKSKGGITPSGWSCTHLPYIVEFDNFGSNSPGTPGHDPFIWGWDEITWFSLRPEAERNDWLRYAWNWLKETDSIGHVEMPGSRTLSPGSGGGPNWYWANTKSDACPNGYNTETVIKELWGTVPTSLSLRNKPYSNMDSRIRRDQAQVYSADGRWFLFPLKIRAKIDAFYAIPVDKGGEAQTPNDFLR
jgi:hypothetical protein